MGTKNVEPKRRKIKILATEKDGGGFSVDISKCTDEELVEVIHELTNDRLKG